VGAKGREALSSSSAVLPIASSRSQSSSLRSSPSVGPPPSAALKASLPLSHSRGCSLPPLQKLSSAAAVRECSLRQRLYWWA